MKRLSLLACLLIITMAAMSQGMVKGYVYEDRNANGKKDRKEKGIQGVSVSNGTDVAQTDSKGQYTLPLGNDNILFVIKPSGYKTPVDQNNLPAFYYIHKPQGSPALEFKGSAATGPLPASVDFGLTPYQEEENFTALIFGDPQAYNLAEMDYFYRGVVKEVEGKQGVSFGLSLGDLVGNDLSLFNPYIDALKKIGIPWYNLMGNHDMNFDAKTDSLSDETYEAHFGPANYAFNQGQVHFIVLDDILYPDPRDEKGYWGGLRPDQLAFVANDLKFVPKDKLIVLAFHIPIWEEGDSFRDEDRQQLFDLLKDYPYTLNLSAHTHIQNQRFFTDAQGWKGAKPHHEYNAGTTSGDWYSGELNEQGVPVSTMRDGTPKGYAYLRFTGNQYVIDYKVAGKPADYQIEIYVPKVVPAQKRTSALIYANFFMGSHHDTLEYRIDNGKWKMMNFQEAFDPAYLNLLNKWDQAEELMPGRRPGNPSESTHLWTGNIPANLKAGEHVIEVRVKDRYGRTFSQKKTIRAAISQQAR
ncbi:calcineurin-like phosphoesterase family protein [Chitinophaga sp. XS-30]|uniref:calcineurin-like phosphoesterase C-terminal domain-containing protein n=1 Tax=Chitinophaga sp. XS-30 TaxID=2604421 RepID=UPI0011DDB0DA|nr:calcineurin-like phosphoesterase family protein [Chitinophaga sp. XS-30]QEH42178.1 metallophosphoesterase [Chitinophaga sp. XS-30]